MKGKGGRLGGGEGQGKGTAADCELRGTHNIQEIKQK